MAGEIIRGEFRAVGSMSGKAPTAGLDEDTGGMWVTLALGAAKVSAVNPVPVTGTVTVDTSALATQATLAALSAKVPALGAAAKADAVPVTIATDDPALQPVSAGSSYATAALTSDASTQLADHAAVREVLVSNPSTATATLWVSLTASAAQGVGTEVPPGESRRFPVSNSNELYVRASGTQVIGYTVL